MTVQWGCDGLSRALGGSGVWTVWQVCGGGDRDITRQIGVIGVHLAPSVWLACRAPPGAETGPRSWGAVSVHGRL